MDEKLDLFYNRRSVRKYADRPVSDQQLSSCSAAMAAPTAMNLKPWEFVVVRDADQLEKLRKISPFSNINAPCAIVVCGNLGVFKRPLMERFGCRTAAPRLRICCLPRRRLALVRFGVGFTPSKG